MRKTFRYRLYPSKEQVVLLASQLAEACFLYNAALEERREAWRMQQVSRTYYDQANQLKAIRAAGDLALANFSCCQDVLRRVDKAFNAFFRRLKAGQTAGYPRFRSWRRFDSITFPSYGDGCGLLGKRLRIQGAGHIKVKRHRPVEGTIKTVTIKRSAGKWYVCLSVEVAARPLPHSEVITGIDVGLSSFAVLADGTEIANPTYYRKAQKVLRIAQRRVARRPNKRSKGRRKAVVLLQKANEHIANQRRDFHHQASRRLVNTYGLIAVEDLNIKGLASGMLAKAVHDAGWASFLDMLSYKAAEAGRTLVKVDPRGTTQRCSGCQATVPKHLGDRWHDCPGCGRAWSRDHNAALNILGLGLSLVAPMWGTSPSIATEAA